MASPVAFTHPNHAVNVTEGVCGFALSLFSELAKSGDANVFISPLSIVLALSMTYLGAKGNTAQQMKTVLGFDLVDDEIVHSTMNDLLKALDHAVKSKLHIANRLYGADHFDFLSEFLKSTKSCYLADMERVNFLRETEASRVLINKWVEQQTADHIKELIPTGVLTSDTGLVLANAIYFKGNWNSQFLKEATRTDKFFITLSQVVEVQMMNQRSIFTTGYNNELKTEVIELSYTDEHLSMIIFLPQKRDGLDHLQANIKPIHLLDPKRTFHMQKSAHKINLYLPRFKLSESCDLANTLGGMGMPDLFSDAAADLSGMTGNRSLYVSAVMHSSYIEVNEEGSEAAAATAVVTNLRSIPMEITFKANHPFMFMIRDNRLKVPLFFGRYMGPAPIRDEL